MATKKIWSIYESGATYDEPLTEIEASSERSALDHAAAFYGVPRGKLYAVPGASKKRRSHSTKKSRSEAMVAKMIGRHVKSSWHGLVDGEIIQWEPFGAGGTDVLVKPVAIVPDVGSMQLTWYASHGLTPIDSKGPLPSRAKVRKLREAEMAESMKKIAERWAKEPLPPKIRR